MSISHLVKSFFGGKEYEHPEFEKVISDSIREFASVTPNFWTAPLKNSSVYNNQVLLWPDAKKLDLIIYCIKKQNESYKPNHYSQQGELEFQQHVVWGSYINTIISGSPQLDPERFELLIKSCAESRLQQWISFRRKIITTLLNQVSHQYSSPGLPIKMIDSLHQFEQKVQSITEKYLEKDKIVLIDKINNCLFSCQHKNNIVRPVQFLAEDQFTPFANNTLKNLPKEELGNWYQLIAKAQESTGARPPLKFQTETGQLIDELGVEKFFCVVNEWFVFLIDFNRHVEPPTLTRQLFSAPKIDFLSKVNTEIIKAFIWMCGHRYDAGNMQILLKLAEKSYTKIPGKGPTAASIGNACFYAFYKHRDFDGINMLSSLKIKIKQPAATKVIDKLLSEAAVQQNLTIHELEDLAIESFQLKNGVGEYLISDSKAVLTITGIGKSEIFWLKPGGTIQKSVPAEIKEKEAEKLKGLKHTQKQIDQATSVQRERIDRMFIADRTWTMDRFKKNYLEHGLMSFLAKKIIWEVIIKGSVTAAFFLQDEWINIDGDLISLDDDTLIRLWHPSMHSADEISKWRQFLMSNKIQQPFKQAFREVYILTPAEASTRNYSNRMAAHILKQHQYVALARTRHWIAKLIGGWDGGDNNIAELRIPEHNLKAQFWVHGSFNEEGLNDNGISIYVSTDQVRFYRIEPYEQVNLIDVPTIVFSEVMRDIDLFVGVASIGNDPGWQDTGDQFPYREYWRSYSFGDLSEIAKNRKELLTDLIPRLKISNVASIEDKFLVLRGKLRTYKIHIGSTNILMEPNDQYLCIVPGPGSIKQSEHLFLPFEGDSGLSIILSKAFLLAEDDKIKDKTIMAQIKRS